MASRILNKESILNSQGFSYMYLMLTLKHWGKKRPAPKWKLCKPELHMLHSMHDSSLEKTGLCVYHRLINAFYFQSPKYSCLENSYL